MTRKPQIDQHLILDAALAEYHAMYRLAEYRLNALDRRIPLISGLLTAFLGSVPVLPQTTQLLALCAIPVSLVWLVRTTINHARSFEDALRRIEHQEHLINERIGVDILGFQGTHPSKGCTVGGRTGTESVLAVGIASGVQLVACEAMAWQINTCVGIAITCSVLFVIVIAGRSVHHWAQYRYEHKE